MKGKIFEKLILVSIFLGVTFGKGLGQREEVKDSESVEKRMINGVPTTLSNWRFIASLSYSEDANVYWKVCSASFLNRRWLVTAAHCVKNRNEATIQPQHLKVKISRESAAASSAECYKREKELPFSRTAMGSWATDEFTVIEIRAHSGYSLSTYDNDIALIKLREEAPSHIETINIYSGTGHLSNCKVAGWGTKQQLPNGFADMFEQKYEISDTLQEIDVPVGVSREECADNLGPTYPANQHLKTFCAGYKTSNTATGKTACIGDSGSPLVCHKGSGLVLYGLVIAGGPKCIPGRHYTIFLDAARYRQWVNSIIDA